MNDTNERRPLLLLFMKAMVKKQIWVPGYTKRNGQVVAGAHKWVNVSNDEHDEHKIVAGQGTVSQKKAHEKLSKQAWWADALHEHKVAHVLHEGTKVADEKYMTDQLSRLGSNLIKGKKTLTGEWAAYHVASADKKAALLAKVKAADKEADLTSGYEAWKSSNPAKVKEAEELAASVAEHAKPLPAGEHEHEKHEPGSPAHEAAKKPAQAAAEPEPKVEPKPEPEKAPEPAKEEPKPEPKPEPAPEPKPEPAKVVAATEEAKPASWSTHAPEGGGKPVAVSYKDLPKFDGAPEKKLALKIGKIQKFAINGDAQGLHDYYNKLLEPKAKAYAKEVVDFMAAKEGEVKAAPAAAEPAPKMDAALKGDAELYFASGDMQGLKDIADYAAKNGFQANAEHAAKLIGELAQKNADSWAKPAHEPAEKPKTGAAALNPMPADGSMPTAPASIDAPVVKVLHKWAKEGPLSHLENYAKPSGDAKMDTEEAYAAQLVDWVHAQSKAAETAAPSLPVLDTSDMGDLHKDAAKAIHDLATKGSAVGHVGGQVSNLQDYYSAFDYAGNNLDDKKIAAYAKDALASLGEEAKHSGATSVPSAPVAAAPVKPNSNFTGAVSQIEQALKEGKSNETLENWAKYDAKGQPDFQEVVDYAKQVKDAIDAKAPQAAATAAANPPVKPDAKNYSVALKDIEDAFKAGKKDDATLHAWAGENGSADPELAKVVNYAKEVIQALNGGPKEGDTKQGAHGMLVLKDGHWVRVSEDKPAATGPKAAEIVSKLSVPKMTGKNSVKLKNIIKELNLAAVTGGADAVKALVTIDGDKVKYKGLIALSHTTQTHGENALKFAQYAKAVYDGVVGGGAVGGGPAAGPKAKKVASKVAGTSVTESESVDGWTQVGPQGGYNPGGTFKDKSGQQWYVKFPAGGEKIAKNELLATKLYALAGVEVPEVKLINQGGKIGLASKIVDGAVANKSALLEGKAPGLLQGFGADAWLANWDTVGNNPAAGKGFDNILFKPDGSAVRIDAGGALLYGGAGGKKQTFENEVTDLKTMLDPKVNPNTAAVFGKMSVADITASVAKIAAIPDHEIEGLVMEFGPGSASERTRLAEKLIARKHNMTEQYPTAKAKAGTATKKAKPDPNALPVDAALLPSPHNFMDWQGTGKPISEKPYVKGNIADEQEILNIALQGNLTALKDYKFQPVDKMTGEAIGAKKSIDEHPSKYVQDFHGQVVSYLDMLANPPEELRPMTAKKASTLASLSAAFKPHDFGMTTAKAPKNQQIGFWIALGVAEDPNKFAPPAKKLAKSEIDAAFEKHPKLPMKVKSFIGGVQGSGSYNNPYRDGLEKDHGGNDTREVLTALYDNATAHAAGTTIHKWINMPPELIKQFKDAPEGLVFQNPGSMCTSYSAEGTKGFGKDRITIRYAEGAKALDSFASGSFKSEMEVTTLPGARFMVLSRKMVADTEHGKDKEQRFELELLMLPPDPTYVDNLQKKA